MNKQIYLRLIILFVFSMFSLNSYSSEEKKTIYNSYINDNMGVWKKTIDAMHFEAKKNNKYARLRDTRIANAREREYTISQKK